VSRGTTSSPQPTDDVRPLDPRLLRASRSARWFLLGAVATGVLRTVAIVGVAWGIAATITEAIDADHVPGLAGRIIPTLAFLLSAFALRSVAAWASETLALRAAARVKGELRQQVLARSADRGPAWLAERSSAAFATTLGPGLDALDPYVGRYLPQLVLTAIVTPVLIVAIWLADLPSGVIVLCAFPVIPVFMVLIGLATQALQRRQQDALARLGGAFLEAVEGLTTLKVFGRARRQVGRIGTITDDYRRGTMGVLRMSFVSGFALELAASLSVALVAITIGVRLIDGTLGLGAALFVLVLAPEAFAPVRQVGADFHAASDGVEASAAVLDVLDDGVPGPDADAPAARRSSSASGQADRRVTTSAVPDGAESGRALRLTGVTAVREGRRIGPVDAVLTAGTVTVLVGPSGAGKSSLLAAVRGAVPAEGTVSLPGGPTLPAGSSPADRAPWITWMDQRPRLLRGTVAENVALSADVDIDAVVGALAAAGLPIDPTADLAAGGTGLSGGQAQRVAFARAVYRATRTGTSVVLLDEPTSALDADAEQVVIAAMRRMADAGAAVLVASHRPAVQAAADARIDLPAPAPGADAGADDDGACGADAVPAAMHA